MSSAELITSAYRAMASTTIVTEVCTAWAVYELHRPPSLGVSQRAEKYGAR